MNIKKFAFVFGLFITFLVILGLLINGSSIKHEPPVEESQYEFALANYLDSINQVWEESDHCKNPLKYTNFIIATENFQTAMKNGDLLKIEETSQELSSVASSLSFQRYGETNFKILYDQKRLSQEIKKLENANIANYPILYYYDLFNIHALCPYNKEDYHAKSSPDSLNGLKR